MITQTESMSPERLLTHHLFGQHIHMLYNIANQLSKCTGHYEPYRTSLREEQVHTFKPTAKFKQAVFKSVLHIQPFYSRHVITVTESCVQ